MNASQLATLHRIAAQHRKHIDDLTRNLDRTTAALEHLEQRIAEAEPTKEKK